MQIDPQRSVPDLVGDMPWARWILASYGLDVAAWGVPLEVACVRAGVPLATVLVPPGSTGGRSNSGPASGHRTLLLRDGAVSTSQQRLRRLLFAPGAFGEIIDPQREAPADHERIVSVMTSSATRADALSTTLLHLPVQAGKTLLAQCSPVSALWMSPAGELQDAYLPSRLSLADVR